MSLPLSLEIVGTDRSHTEAGGREGDLIAWPFGGQRLPNPRQAICPSGVELACSPWKCFSMQSGGAC